MPTNDRVLESAPFFTGQKSGLPPQTLKATDCEVVKNLLPKRGILAKAFGDSTYAVVGTSGRIHWLEKIQNRWLVQRGVGLHLETSEDSAVFADIGVSLTDTIPQSDFYRGELYLFNGTDQKFYSVDNGLKNLGLQTPISPTALDATSTAQIVKGTGGSLNDESVYKVTFTYYDPITNTESLPVNVRPNAYGLCPAGLESVNYWSVSLGTGEDDFTIKATYLATVFAATFNGTTLRDTARATKIRVYMTGSSTSVSANIFRLKTELDITGLADIAVTTEATGVILTQDTPAPPDKLRQQEAYAYKKNGSVTSSYSVPANVGASIIKSGRFYKDTLFSFGHKGVQFPEGSSTPQSYDSILLIHEPFQPEYIFDTREVGNGDGQEGTAVALLRDSVVVLLKERSTYYLSGSSVDNYVVSLMDPRRGAVSANTVKETPYGVIALDRSGVIMIDAVGPSKLISEDIEDVIESINFEAISTAYSAYDAKESRYYLALPVEGSSTPNKTIVYKADEKNWSILEGQEGASMRFQVSSTNQSRTLIGSAVTGRLARADIESAVTIGDGAAIDMEYFSGPFYGGDPTRKKKAKFVYITAESNTDFDIDIEVVPDFGQSQSQVISGINSNSIYSLWAASLLDSGVNVGVWDQSLWSAARIRKQLKIPVSCVGYCFQIRIRNDSTDTNQYGFRILALQLECVSMGK